MATTTVRDGRKPEVDQPTREPRKGRKAQTLEVSVGPTGLRTLRGKRRSRYNATKHGIFREGIIEGRESRDQYDYLLAALVHHFQPDGALEELLVEKLAMLFWRYRRLLCAERGEIEGIERPSLMSMHGDTSDRLVRYEASLERGIDRTLNQLERQQRRRLGERDLPPIKVDLST